jgi:hypothetical protein
MNKENNGVSSFGFSILIIIKGVGGKWILSKHA